MATATAQPVSNRMIVLTLTEQEAETLHTVTRKISGSVETSRRGHTDSIGKALRELGIKYSYAGSGAIRFEREASINSPISDDQPPF
jgi:hypothetical protein